MAATSGAGAASAAPLILPSRVDDGSRRSVVFLPPDGAHSCVAQFGSGERTSRPYAVKLGGPSRQISWTVGRKTRGRWALYLSCGASQGDPTSLGTTERVFATGRSRRSRVTIRRDSFRSASGWIPLHAPRVRHRKRSAHAADADDEIDTGYARKCSGVLNRIYMSKAYAVGYGYGARVGFAPTWLAYDTENVDGVWSALQSCVPWPALTSSETDSIFKQMVCHIAFAIHGGAGPSWDFEAWRSDPSWFQALNPSNRCQNWGNVPGAAAEFLGHIVQGSLDTSSQRAAYLIDNLDGVWVTRHILTSKAFYCLKAQGDQGPDVLASDFLIDEATPGPAIGDEACGLPTPTPGPGPLPGPLPAGAFYVQNADGGIYWRSGPDWTTAEPSAGNGFYPGTVIRPSCYQTGAANVPGSSDAMWEQATWVSGPGSGGGWINEHFVADGQPINQPSPGVPSCSAPAPPPPPETWSEQETPNHPVNTFTDYHNASGMGQAIGAGQWVQVSCKVYDPTIPSVNPDGYWYRIATAPWNNAYYSPANTFMNGDPYGGPYTHNTDFNVPDC